MSQKRIDLLFSAMVVVLLVWAVWEASAWPVHSRIFPWSIGIGVLLLALVQLVASVRRAMHPGPPEDIDTALGGNPQDREVQGSRAMVSEGAVRPTASARRRGVVMCSWILVFFLGVWVLGFRVGAFVLTTAFLKLGAAERWRVSLVAGGISYLFFFLVFHLMLQVPLPAGLLAESLGADSLDDYAIRSVGRLVR